MNTFTSTSGSDINDDSENLEIFRGGKCEMSVTVFLDDRFEIYPPKKGRTYDASEVAEILRLVVPFVIETLVGNAIDRESDLRYYGESNELLP